MFKGCTICYEEAQKTYAGIKTNLLSLYFSKKEVFNVLYDKRLALMSDVFLIQRFQPLWEFRIGNLIRKSHLVINMSKGGPFVATLTITIFSTLILNFSFKRRYNLQF